MTISYHTANGLNGDHPEKYMSELHDSELLTLLLNCGKFSKKKQQLLSQCLANISLKNLTQLSLEDLIAKFGIGRTQAISLMVALELGQRLQSTQKLALTTPENTMCYLGDMGGLDKEHFRCLYLNTKKYLIKMETISIGDLSSSIAHPREIFYPAIQHLADSIIVAHNHPSGDSTPSETDIKLTKRLIKAGELLGIALVDHIIVSAEGFVSMRRNHLI